MDELERLIAIDDVHRAQLERALITLALDVRSGASVPDVARRMELIADRHRFAPRISREDRRYVAAKRRAFRRAHLSVVK